MAGNALPAPHAGKVLSCSRGQGRGQSGDATGAVRATCASACSQIAASGVLVSWAQLCNTDGPHSCCVTTAVAVTPTCRRHIRVLRGQQRASQATTGAALCVARALQCHRSPSRRVLPAIVPSPWADRQCRRERSRTKPAPRIANPTGAHNGVPCTSAVGARTAAVAVVVVWRHVRCEGTGC